MSATTKSPAEVRDKLASSLVIVGEIGGNDYNYAFAANRPRPGGRSAADVGRMVTGVVESVVLVPEVVRSRGERGEGGARDERDAGGDPGQLPAGLCVPSYLAAVDETEAARRTTGTGASWVSTCSRRCTTCCCSRGSGS